MFWFFRLPKCGSFWTEDKLGFLLYEMTGWGNNYQLPNTTNLHVHGPALSFLLGFPGGPETGVLGLRWSWACLWIPSCLLWFCKRTHSSDHLLGKVKVSLCYLYIIFLIEDLTYTPKFHIEPEHVFICRFHVTSIHLWIQMCVFLLSLSLYLLHRHFYKPLRNCTPTPRPTFSPRFLHSVFGAPPIGGLHVSPSAPADEVFFTIVGPSESSLWPWGNELERLRLVMKLRQPWKKKRRFDGIYLPCLYYFTREKHEKHRGFVSLPESQKFRWGLSKLP